MKDLARLVRIYPSNLKSKSKTSSLTRESVCIFFAKAHFEITKLHICFECVIELTPGIMQSKFDLLYSNYASKLHVLKFNGKMHMMTSTVVLT